MILLANLRNLLIWRIFFGNSTAPWGYSMWKLVTQISLSLLNVSLH